MLILIIFILVKFTFIRGLDWSKIKCFHFFHTIHFYTIHWMSIILNMFERACVYVLWVMSSWIMLQIHLAEWGRISILSPWRSDLEFPHRVMFSKTVAEGRNRTHQVQIYERMSVVLRRTLTFLDYQTECIALKHDPPICQGSAGGCSM